MVSMRVPDSHSAQRLGSSGGLLLAVSWSLLVSIALIPAGSAAELFRWEGARLSAVTPPRFDAGRIVDADTTQSSVYKTLHDVPWADARDWVHNPPQIIQELRNYKRQGMPILHLVNTSQTVVALGLSNHGKPGLYFTRKLPF